MGCGPLATVALASEYQMMLQVILGIVHAMVGWALCQCYHLGRSQSVNAVQRTSMTESEISTESVGRSMLLKRIIYLASRIFSRGLKWVADWQTGVKPALRPMSRN